MTTSKRLTDHTPKKVLLSDFIEKLKKNLDTGNYRGVLIVVTTSKGGAEHFVSPADCSQLELLGAVKLLEMAVYEQKV